MKRGLGRTWGILLLATFTSGALSGCLRDTRSVVERERRESFDLLTRGQRLKDSGDYLLARDILLEAAEVSPRPVVFYEIGNCYYHLGNLPQAEVYYQRALALAPDYSLAQAELDLVRQASRNAEMEQAAAEPEPRALVSQPVHEEQAEEAEETVAITGTTSPAQAVEVPVEEEPEEPPVDERQAVAPPPDEPAVLVTPLDIPATQPAVPSPDDPAGASVAARERPTGLTGMFGGISPAQDTDEADAAPVDIDPEEARLAIFPELYSATPATVESLEAEARNAERLGHFDKAVRDWSAVISRRPEDVDARLRLAHALYRSGRSRRAEQEYESAIRIDPENPETYFEQGNFYVLSGDRPAARRAFRQALTINPRHLRARNNLGALEMQLGNHEDAIYYLEQVVETQPDFSSAWLNLALAQDNSGVPARQVLETLERYQRLSPGLDTRTERWLQSLQRRAAGQQ